MAFSFLAIHAEFVSTVWPIRSSSPMVITSACIGMIIQHCKDGESKVDELTCIKSFEHEK